MEYRGFHTGCSMGAPKKTVAIASATSTQQIPVALEMATRVLRAAKLMNNEPSVALFGTGLSDVRADSARTVNLLKRVAETGWGDANGQIVDRVSVVVGAHDLAMLRLMPSARLGEVCRIPKCEAALCSVSPEIAELEQADVKAAIECLLRPPAIEFADSSELPLAWQEHDEELAMFRWLEDLFDQSLKDLEAEAKAAAKAEAAGVVDVEAEAPKAKPSPFDVLSLSMYYKLASIAFRTTDMQQQVVRAVVAKVEGADDAGLLRVFPVDGIAPSFLTFVESYLVGDDDPWEVTALGERAAAKARVVLDRVFEHAERVGSVLALSKLAMVVEDDTGMMDERSKDRILLVQGGPGGDVAKLLADRLPTTATAIGGRFVVATVEDRGDSWAETLNAEFREVVAALTSELTDAPPAAIRKRLAAYTALSSRFLLVHADTKAHDTLSAFSHTARNVVSTYPAGAAAHVARELTVRENFILTNGTMASVAVQPGLSVGCTFLTFCPSMAMTLSTDASRMIDFEGVDLTGAQAAVSAIANAMESPTVPLGLLRGVLGGVVELYGETHRVAFWRLGDAEVDTFITLLPKHLIDIAFADYKTGSRSLDDDELHPDSPLPFFAADSVVTVFPTSVLAGSEGRAFKVPNADRLPLLGGDEAKLYAAYEAGLRKGVRQGTSLQLPAALSKSAESFLVREAANDRLAGLRVAWAKKAVGVGDARATLPVLVSDNAARERVAY